MIIEFHLKQAEKTQLHVLLRALTALNVQYLRDNPATPSLRQSGVRYQQQAAGCERFLTIPLILAAGGGDCDQLAPWRCAELRVRHNIRAMPEVKRMGPHLWHVFVRMPDGKVEDISAHLGMKIPPKLAELGRALLKRQHAPAAPTSRSVRARRTWQGY